MWLAFVKLCKQADKSERFLPIVLKVDAPNSSRQARNGSESTDSNACQRSIKPSFNINNLA